MNPVDGFVSLRDVERREPGVVFVSDIIKPCMRCAYLDIVAPKPLPVEKRRLFESGRLVEHRWINALRKRPDTHVLSAQLPTYHQSEGFRIHGRIDALVQHERGSLVVHEVKSIKSLYYVKVPIPEHVDQLQFYLNILGLENGQIDYIAKSILSTGTGEKADASFTVKSDARTFTALLEKAGTFHRYLVQRETPPRETCWLCRHCLHGDACA